MITRQKYQDYINVLKEELIPAMGCTEPIAIAYAGAIAREHLGCLPERVEIEVSGNIIKNVKSVIDLIQGDCAVLKWQRQQVVWQEMPRRSLKLFRK